MAEAKGCMVHDLNVFYIMRLNKGACRVCELFICVLLCVFWYKGKRVARGVCNTVIMTSLCNYVCVL